MDLNVAVLVAMAGGHRKGGIAGDRAALGQLGGDLVMGGMIAATFLAIFFVPLFFRVIFDRRLTETRSHDDLVKEIEHAHALHARPAVQTPGHPPLTGTRGDHE